MPRLAARVRNLENITGAFRHVLDRAVQNVKPSKMLNEILSHVDTASYNVKTNSFEVKFK